MLTSVISVFFYLRVVVMMYMAEPTPGTVRPGIGPIALGALAVSTLVIFYLGVLPTRVLDLAAASVGTIF